MPLFLRATKAVPEVVISIQSVPVGPLAPPMVVSPHTVIEPLALLAAKAPWLLKRLV